MPYHLKRNFETILHAIVIGYVWSQRKSLQKASIWDEPHFDTYLKHAAVTSDYVSNEKRLAYLPEQMGHVTLVNSEGVIPIVITPRVRGAH